MEKVVKNNFDEAAVIVQCRSGDIDAMERLITKYQDRVYNIILKICANPADAADLSQETFVRVIENIGKFQGKSSFYTWVFRIAVNLTLTHCARAAKRRVASLDNGANERIEGELLALKALLRNNSSPDPAAVIERRELAELVTKAMMKLDDDQRAVVVLRDIEGMNYAQIARVLDTELGTVKSRLSRARGNLREIMRAVLQ